MACRSPLHRRLLGLATLPPSMPPGAPDVHPARSFRWTVKPWPRNCTPGVRPVFVVSTATTGLCFNVVGIFALYDLPFIFYRSSKRSRLFGALHSSPRRTPAISTRTENAAAAVDLLLQALVRVRPHLQLKTFLVIAPFGSSAPDAASALRAFERKDAHLTSMLCSSALSCHDTTPRSIELFTKLLVY